MIFVTTGTHNLPFDRLLKMINDLVKKLSISEEVVIQSGTSKLLFDGIKTFSFLSHEDFINYLKKARIIITSAGPATIFQALLNNKNLPLVVPRVKKYGEHVSDHQLYFAEYLSEKSLCKVIYSTEDLIDLFKSGNEAEALDKKISLSSKDLNRAIKEYLMV